MSIRLMSDVFRTVHGIPSGRRMLLLVLADFANDEGICWPSIKSLAEASDLGERHVSAELKELARDGYITIEEHAGKSNHYRLTIAQGVNHSSGVNHSASRTTVQGRDEPQFTTTPEPQFTQTINKPSENRKSIGATKTKHLEYPPDFEEFWKAYPSGNGVKKVAFQRWKELRPDDELRGEIMQGLEAWHRSQRWADGYVKAAEIWLRDRYWENPAPAAVASAFQSALS